MNIPLAISLMILTSAMLLLEHWFPNWDQFLGRFVEEKTRTASPVRLVANYVAGTVAWFVPFSIWAIVEGYLYPVLIGWAFLVVGGLTVVFAYLHDRSAREKNRLKELEEERDLLNEQAARIRQDG